MFYCLEKTSENGGPSSKRPTVLLFRSENNLNSFSVLSGFASTENSDLHSCEPAFQLFVLFSRMDIGEQITRRGREMTCRELKEGLAQNTSVN